MTELTLSDSGRFRTVQDAAPSYFEYHARRTLPGDKKLETFHAQLRHYYMVCALEHEIRKRKRS